MNNEEASESLAVLKHNLKEALSLGSVLNAVTESNSDIKLEELSGTTDVLEQALFKATQACKELESLYFEANEQNK
tara:strand:+ start:1779 stop:2006 length:228 start_codon:yes stop_codon:yes gene_type:complete